VHALRLLLVAPGAASADFLHLLAEEDSARKIVLDALLAWPAVETNGCHVCVRVIVLRIYVISDR
jgi:hypothetical protein